MQTERKPFRGVKLFFIGYFALLVLLLTFVGSMDWMGYKIIDISIEFAFLGLLICSALIACGIRLVKRIRNRGVKLLTGTLIAIAVFVAAAALMMGYSMLMFSNMPVHYTTLESPDGKGAVVLRSLSQDKEAADARRAERLQADPEGDVGESALSDLGYSYTAHPRFAKFFYNSKLSCEGSVEIGCTSAAQLMYEWTDDGALHMYVENPEAHDGGELTLRMQ